MKAGGNTGSPWKSWQRTWASSKIPSTAGSSAGRCLRIESVGSGSSSSQPWMSGFALAAGTRETPSQLTESSISRPASRARHVVAVGTQRFTRVR